MNRTDLAAIAAYISASISEAHVARDLSDTLDEYPGSDMVREAERDLQEAAEFLEACFQALPEELREYLEDLAAPELPAFQAVRPTSVDIDTWAEMDPAERCEFIRGHFPTLVP